MLVGRLLLLSGLALNPRVLLAAGTGYQVRTLLCAHSGSLGTPLSYDVVTRIIRLFSSIQSTALVIQFQPTIAAKEA